MSKAFASQADLEEKRITFAELGGGAYAYTAEGDPNSGVVVGDDGVMVLDTQATPVMAQDVMERIRGRDRSADPLRGADALPRGPCPRRLGLWRAGRSLRARTPVT